MVRALIAAGRPRSAVLDYQAKDHSNNRPARRRWLLARLHLASGPPGGWQTWLAIVFLATGAILSAVGIRTAATGVLLLGILPGSMTVLDVLRRYKAHRRTQKRRRTRKSNP
jgi:hypothetical protein